MSKRRKFDLFIIGGFSFLIILIILLSFHGYARFNTIRALFETTYQHSFQTLVETEQANADLIAMHRAMKDVALSRNDVHLQAALKDVSAYNARFRSYLSRMAGTHSGDLLLDGVVQAFEDWEPIRTRTIELTKNGDYEAAAEITRTAGSDQVELIRSRMQLLIDEHKALADNAYRQSEDLVAGSRQLLLTMTIGAVILAVFMSLYIRGRLLLFQSLLHDEKEKLEITFNSIGDGVITTDMEGKGTGLNKVAEDFTGWTSWEAAGRPFKRIFDITNAATGQRAKDPVEEVLLTDSACLLENHTILTSRNGMQRHVADSAAPIKDEKGRTSGVVMIFRDVTERKNAERLLRESELRFRTIFEQAPIGIAVNDSITGLNIDLNERYAEIIGRSKEELQHNDWMSITHPDDLQKNLDMMALFNAGEIQSYRMEKRYIRPDKSVVWVDMSITRLVITALENPVHLCMIENITQQKLAENELVVSENRLRAAQAIANVGNWEVDLDSNTLWASEQAFNIYGFKYDSPFIPLKKAQAIVAQEDRPLMDEALKLLVEENRPYDVQFRIRRENDGVVRIIHSTAVVERDGSGTPLKVVGIIQDITELKNAELALAQSNTMLEATLQATADGIEALSIDGNFFFFNENFKEMWGVSDDLTMDELFLLIQSKQVNPNKALSGIGDLIRILDNEPSRELVLKDGQTYERFARPILVDGEVTGYVLSYRNISEKKRWEQALLASEARHKAMIANISDTIAIVGIHGRLRYISPNLEELFGWRQEELLKADLFNYVASDDIEDVRTAFKELMRVQGMKITAEFKIRCKDRRYRYIRLTAVNMIEDRAIRGILMNFHDISDRKKREIEILYLNYHDQLTGLYNRAFFEEECTRLNTKRQLPISVIMGDINGLKLINDAFGHKEGDKLLIEIAKLLSACCRKEDILARTGGDEFCILLPKTSEAEAQNICRRILTECINYGSRAEKDAFYLSISLGHATKTEHATSIESILTKAEEFMYKQKLLERKSMRSSLLSSIKTTMYEKSHLTAEHEERLVTLSKRVGQALNLSDAQLSELELLSTLHDLGKLSIDDQILNKPGMLTEAEWIEIRKHPEVGYRIAQASPELAPIAEYILCHHERWDGMGYPQGLKADAIPLLSRIVSIVDAYDAMTQDRPYRRSLSEAEAVAEISACAGAQFDPFLAQVFTEILREHLP